MTSVTTVRSHALIRTFSCAASLSYPHTIYDITHTSPPTHTHTSPHTHAHTSIPHIPTHLHLHVHVHVRTPTPSPTHYTHPHISIYTHPHFSTYTHIHIFHLHTYTSSHTHFWPTAEDGQLLVTIPKVRLVQLKERNGLIRARVKGVDAAIGPVLTFLDSHCEVTTGWLQPLLSRIKSVSVCVCVWSWLLLSC